MQSSGFELPSAVKIESLYKSFGETKAISGITFSVEKGEIFGLVGPDGAGKTTAIRILCGLLAPDSGDIEVLGMDLLKKKNIIKKDIGYLSQKFSLYADLSVDENIEFFAGIHGVADFSKRREELLDFTRLGNFRKFLAGKLSGGMKQKLALACTLIHKPAIIFLDEPTTGVDPVSRRDFWKILSDLHGDGVTMLISTPYLDEAERFSKVAMLNSGKVLTCGTPESIRTSVKGSITEVTSPDLWNAYNKLKEISDYEVQLFGDRLDVVSPGGSDPGSIGKLLKESGVEVTGMRQKQVSLENAFIHLLKTA